jgi:hypothetical protein
MILTCCQRLGGVFQRSVNTLCGSPDRLQRSSSVGYLSSDRLKAVSMSVSAELIVSM